MEEKQIQQRKTVLITGSGRGIGKATALCFAKKAAANYHIVINNCKNTNELNETLQAVSAIRGSSCIAIQADVGNFDSCRALFAQIEQTFGSVDILVNNAGTSHIGLFTDQTPNDWEGLLRTDLFSVLNCCRLAVPAMVSKKKGKIINVSSVWGHTGASCEAVYSAAKGGVNAFTRALGKELAPSNIQVNAVACGLIDTQMNAAFTAEERGTLINEIPACRMGTANEAAELIYALACGHSYINGQVITLDGGWT